MAKTSVISIDTGFQNQYDTALQSGDRFTYTRVGRKIIFSGRKKIKGLTEKSLLPQIASDWAALSSGVQTAWKNAGLACGLTGWKAYLKDKCIRIQTGLSGDATPSNLHQDYVGRLSVASPATSAKIAQLHPFSYFIYKKVVGTKSQYNPVPVNESFSMPVEIGISYKSALTSLGVGARARFWLEIISSYQGQDLTTVLACDFSLVADWSRLTKSISEVKGLARGYTAYIEIFNARGDIWFDDILIEHNSQNWARDPNCNDIQQVFTAQFAQVPRHWVAVDLPDGTEYRSIYPL